MNTEGIRNFVDGLTDDELDVLMEAVCTRQGTEEEEEDELPDVTDRLSDNEIRKCHFCGKPATKEMHLLLNTFWMYLDDPRDADTDTEIDLVTWYECKEHEGYLPNDPKIAKTILSQVMNYAVEMLE